MKIWNICKVNLSKSNTCLFQTIMVPQIMIDLDKCHCILMVVSKKCIIKKSWFFIVAFKWSKVTVRYTTAIKAMLYQLAQAYHGYLNIHESSQCLTETYQCFHLTLSIPWYWAYHFVDVTSDFFCSQTTWHIEFTF